MQRFGATRPCDPLDVSLRHRPRRDIFSPIEVGRECSCRDFQRADAAKTVYFGLIILDDALAAAHAGVLVSSPGDCQRPAGQHRAARR